MLGSLSSQKGVWSTIALLVASLSSVMPIQESNGAEPELNLYTSRHYKTDQALYDDFAKQTGMKVNLIEGKDDELIERIKSEGKTSPVDVFCTVDAGRLWRADQEGLFAPTTSEVLEESIPEYLRHPKGHWYGFSKRARVILYNKEKVDAGAVDSYEDLADPKWKGKVLIRSSGNIYNQSLLAAMIASQGEEASETWAKGVVENMARAPEGGDTDQIKALAAGEGDLAVSNTYYLARLIASDKAEDKAVAAKVGVIFPNQSDRGTHVNVSGCGVAANAPHAEAALKFLEYLITPSAQEYFANGNNEYPVVKGVAPGSIISGFGEFKEQPLDATVYGENNPKAVMIFDRVGWK